MRVTSNMVTSRYLRTLNNVNSDLNDYSNQVSSGRAFSDFSDNTSAAVKAYKIRSNMSRIEGYQSNIRHAKSALIDSESALSQMNDIYGNAMGKILAGMNSTQSAEERSIIAAELRSLQEELLQTLNTNISGDYLFGGTNTSTEPFTVDTATGKLAYNGVVLDNADDTAASELSSDIRYLDIGLNMQFDASSKLVKSTAFGYSISGIDIIGYGNTAETLDDGTALTISNNMYDLLGQIADALDSSEPEYSYEKVNAMYGQLETSAARITRCVTNVGAKGNYLEFMTNRYETQTMNLEEHQSDVEDIDAAYAIIKYKTQEVAYNAALQMGASVIQNSIFNYMS